MKVIFEHQSHPAGLGFLVKEYVQTYFTSSFHFHDLYELIWIKKSYGKLYAGKNIMNFQEGDVYLFGPGFGHCFYNEKAFIEQGEKAHAVAIFFKADFLGEGFFNNAAYVRVKDMLDQSSFGLHIHHIPPPIHDLFASLIKQNGMDELITFLQLLNEVSRLPQTDVKVLNETLSAMKLTNKDSARLEPVLKYVIENFRDELDSRTAAALIHLNEAAFCRYFKRRMEQTFSQFVNNVRITHATNLLLTEEWDVLRICYESGFKNLSYFNRQFREIIGQSPKAYRKAFQGTNEELVMDNQAD
jgi:AraC-like DNA-binding protein